MGFLSRLFGLPSFGGATNALLVELMMPKLSATQRSQLKAQLVTVFRNGGFPNIKPEAAMASLNRAPRIAQLNFLALAMNELGMQPPLKNEFWHEVRNPFDPSIADEKSLWAVSQRLKSTHGVDISVGRDAISFDTW
jgi:hypothetical protein